MHVLRLVRLPTCCVRIQKWPGRRTGPARELAPDLHELYFPARLGFLTRDPERELSALTSLQELREQARQLRARLALPGTSALAGLASRDPLGAFERIIARVGATAPGIRIEAEQFVSIDGQQALVLVQTRPPAFDTSRQAPLLASIDETFERVRERSPDDGLQLEASGINRFAVRIEEKIRGDTMRIIVLSMTGLAVLFMVFFRSPAVFRAGHSSPADGHPRGHLCRHPGAR